MYDYFHVFCDLGHLLCLLLFNKTRVTLHLGYRGNEPFRIPKFTLCHLRITLRCYQQKIENNGRSTCVSCFVRSYIFLLEHVI